LVPVQDAHGRGEPETDIAAFLALPSKRSSKRPEQDRSNPSQLDLLSLRAGGPEPRLPDHCWCGSVTAGCSIEGTGDCSGLRVMSKSARPLSHRFPAQSSDPSDSASSASSGSERADSEIAS